MGDSTRRVSTRGIWPHGRCCRTRSATAGSRRSASPTSPCTTWRTSSRTGDIAPAVNQIQYYIGFTEPVITGFCHDRDILVEAYSPLATGDILDNAAVQEIAGSHRVSLAQVALRFCLQNGVLPLPKAVGPDHIRDNAALDFQLSDQEMALLNELPDAAPGHYHNPTQG
jgi:diketogulonate reductase-like aldo/keto reductase